MDKQILDIFYNELLVEATSDNPISIGDWKFNVNFSIDSLKNINNKIIVNIKNKTIFNEALIKYTENMIEHIVTNDKLKNIEYIFFDGNMHHMIKSTLLNVWYNATEEDFKDPVAYLKLRTDFLNDELSKKTLNKTYKSDKILKLNNLFIENNIDIQNPSANETPFVFKTKVTDGFDNYYNLPNISYGISNGKCYIYAIKKDKQIKDEFSKKVNRALYKANKNLIYNDDDENIKDVSVSQLFSATAFLKFLNDNNIDEIVIKNYFPIRYEAKEITINKKIKKLKEQLSNLNVNNEKYLVQKKEIDQLEEENNRIQNNIINKYLRIFRRLQYHFPNIHITSYPYELDNNMHLKVLEYRQYNSDHILNDIYEGIDFNKDRQNRF